MRCTAAELRALVRELEQGRARAQAAVLASVLAEDYEPCGVGELAERAGVSESAVRALQARGILAARERELIRRPEPGEPLFAYAAPTLNAAQERVLSAVTRAQGEHRFAPFLLCGVTGSGKTEVYIRAIERALAAGRTALVLVPEISLTPQAMERYRHRLGDRVGILHSGLSGGERFDAWRRARSGELSVIIGTRSAVFAPLSKLGLIVVDEEHDGSYKQDDPAPRYHGRDVAMMRARLAACPILLGSATPALESYTNALEKKYTLLSLPRRAVEHDLPDVELVDMRGHDPDKGPLSDELAEALDECLAAGGQAILFLNRRGFSPQVLCARCGHIVQCPSCSVALVQHKQPPGLLCHHCEHRQPEPRICPACHGEWMRYRGVGTEQLAQWVEENYAGARIARLDLDTTRKRDAHTRLLSAFRRRETDVLVGTQMISKGLDMPGVTLVGVIDADIGLAMPDFRSAERTFMLLTQVAGRAGRGEHPGRVFIQSHCPNPYAVLAAISQNYEAL
ncbi:primosomal protein N' [bacterium]|nr:primosomal protein N' [bacterium]